MKKASQDDSCWGKMLRDALPSRHACVKYVMFVHVTLGCCPTVFLNQSAGAQWGAGMNKRATELQKIHIKETNKLDIILFHL